MNTNTQGTSSDAELASSSLEGACGTLSEGQRPAAHSDRGAPLPLARLDSHMREERAGQVDVEEGVFSQA